MHQDFFQNAVVEIALTPSRVDQQVAVAPAKRLITHVNPTGLNVCT